MDFVPAGDEEELDDEHCCDTGVDAVDHCSHDVAVGNLHALDCLEVFDVATAAVAVVVVCCQIAVVVAAAREDGW